MDGDITELSVGAKGTVTGVMVVIDRWVATSVAAGGVLVLGTMIVAPMGGFGSAVVAGPATVTVTGDIASSTALGGSAEGTGTMTASAAEEILPLAGVGSIAGRPECCRILWLRTLDAGTDFIRLLLVGEGTVVPVGTQDRALSEGSRQSTSKVEIDRGARCAMVQGCLLAQW